MQRTVSSITRQDVVDYRKKLLQEDLSTGTVVKRVGLISTLLERAVRDGLIQTNPAKGATAGLKDNGKEKRLPFSKEDVALLLKPANLSTLDPDAKLLLRMLVYTGARLEEIAQLTVGDVKATPVPHITITDRGEEQKVKNKGSRRLVPLHRDIAKVVLMAAAGRPPESYLLPSLVANQYGQRGAKVGKDLGKYIRSLGITDKRKTLHSARHRFKDACRDAGVPLEVHDRLTGHTTPGVGGQYGTGHSLEVLHGWVQRVKP